MNEPFRTDGKLLAEFADAGREPALAELMARHGPMVHGVALRVLADHHEAQDVTQAVFCTLARKAKRLRKDASVGGWLHRVAWCLAMDIKSSRASRQRREEETMRAQTDALRESEREGQFREELDDALNRLPERYRQPLVLFHIEGHSLDATAQMLGLNVGTVGSQLSRAREMLRAKLARRGVAVGSVGALTTLLSAEAGAATLPATFVSATVKAASLVPAGQLAAGVTAGTVSANVVALTKGAANMLFWSSVKTAAIAVAITGAVVGTGTVVAQKAMDASPSVGVASESKTTEVSSLVHLRREQNLLVADLVCSTNNWQFARFETLNPPLIWTLSTESVRGEGTSFTLFGQNDKERAGSGISSFALHPDGSNFWVRVFYGTKHPIACIEYIQAANQLRLIRTVWKEDGRSLDPDKRLDVRTGPNIEELKTKAGDELRNYLAPVLAMITPEDLIGPQDDLPDYEMWPFRNRAELPQQEQESLQKADEAFARGKYLEAIVLYDGLVAVNPKSPAIPYTLVLKGRCQGKIGSMKAAAQYREVLDYFPDNADFAAPSLFYLARIAAKERDFRQSLRDLAVLEMDKRYKTHDVMPTARRLKAIVVKLAGTTDAVTRFFETDNGETVTIPVGQLFEVHLTNDREGAGWEPGATEISGKSVVRVDNLRRMNCDAFTPLDPSTNSTKGTYIYRYEAAATGESHLRLTHLYPSGPKPVVRYATQFIGEFKLTVVVRDGGLTADDAVTPAHLKDWVAFARSGEFQKSEQVKITEETPPAKSGEWTIRKGQIAGLPIEFNGDRTSDSRRVIVRSIPKEKAEKIVSSLREAMGKETDQKGDYHSWREVTGGPKVTDQKLLHVTINEDRKPGTLVFMVFFGPNFVQ